MALTRDGHDGQTYMLTGPQAITFEQVAGELWEAGGRRSGSWTCPTRRRCRAWSSGMPEFVAGQIVAVFGFLRRGAQDRTTDTVRTLTGRSQAASPSSPATTPCCSAATPVSTSRSYQQALTRRRGPEATQPGLPWLLA